MFDNIRKNMDSWKKKLNSLAQDGNIHSVLIMESLPDTMTVVAANDQDVYKPNDAGPKSVQPGCHELYCERVVNMNQPLLVSDASADPEWKGNEDLVKFGLGVYLGYPLIHQGKSVGTICCLNRDPVDFESGTPSIRKRVETLKVELEAELG